jgi:hypothetical protein
MAESTNIVDAKFAEAQELLANTAADVANFTQKGNAAAGSRIRGAMQTLKVLAQEIRVEVINTKKAKTAAKAAPAPAKAVKKAKATK